MTPVAYHPFLDQHIANDIFHELYGNPSWTGIHWERRETAPRYEYWCNDFHQSYTYGKNLGQRTYESQGWPDCVRQIQQWLKTSRGWYFEGCFLNGYNDNRDQLGWHTDDDPFINHALPIAVVTLGCPRLIEFKPIGAPNSEKTSIMLEHGSLCVMNAGMQQTHLHRIPKAGFIAQPRISLTFRSLLKKPG